MLSSQFIGTKLKSVKQDPALGQNEVRSIDWLSRSNETLIRVCRPAPSDEQLIALQVAIVRLLANLKDVALDAFRRIASRQIQPH